MQGDDIRDCGRIEHADIIALNFIRPHPPYIFRPHFRSGLRSRILEMLSPDAVEREQGGVMVDGLRCFPRARPIKMLRIFRRCFHDLGDALEETRRLKIVEGHLGPDFIARSSEFYVDYRCGRSRQILLCGLQDYISGVALDPWQADGAGYIDGLERRLRGTASGGAPAMFRGRLLDQVAKFTACIRSMMDADGLIPDLAGARNLLVTVDARVCLVDINNIHPVSFGPQVPLDDKGYPVMDRSIEALERLDRHLLGRSILAADAAYRIFFSPVRRRRVKDCQARFCRMTSSR